MRLSYHDEFISMNIFYVILNEIIEVFIKKKKFFLKALMVSMDTCFLLDY